MDLQIKILERRIFHINCAHPIIQQNHEVAIS